MTKTLDELGAEWDAARVKARATEAVAAVKAETEAWVAYLAAWKETRHMLGPLGKGTAMTD